MNSYEDHRNPIHFIPCWISFGSYQLVALQQPPEIAMRISCGWANVSKAFDTVVGDASSADPTGLQDQARHVGFCCFFFKPIKGLHSFYVKPLKLVQVGGQRGQLTIVLFSF